MPLSYTMLYANYISVKLGKTFLIKNKYQINVVVYFVLSFLVPSLKTHEFTLFQDGFVKSSK